MDDYFEVQAQNLIIQNGQKEYSQISTGPCSEKELVINFPDLFEGG